MSVEIFKFRSAPVAETITGVQKETEDTTPREITYINEETNSTRSTNVQKYVYQYGIKNIKLQNSLYNQTGVFVSKPIQLKGNIIEVSLDTVEEHPLFDELKGMATDRFTSIEYYVALKENPSLNDWIPILPEGQSTIKSEKLFFKGSHATLRFHASISEDEKTNVYKNGIKLSKDDWYFTNRGASIQLVPSYEQDAIYTIDYVPDTNYVNPYTVQVGEKNSQCVRTTEVFENGADYNNTVRLSNYPYINYETINSTSAFNPNTSEYRPIEVFLRDTTILNAENKIQDEFFPEGYTKDGQYCTRNKTDYISGKDVNLTRYKLEGKEQYTTFDYKQEKNKLIFTENFNRSRLSSNSDLHHGKAKIEVQYDYLQTSFRLKIILRKNCGDDLIVTPVADQYQLKFKVMK